VISGCCQGLDDVPELMGGLREAVDEEHGALGPGCCRGVALLIVDTYFGVGLREICLMRLNYWDGG
jgi:hypothetical protein